MHSKCGGKEKILLNMRPVETSDFTGFYKRLSQCDEKVAYIDHSKEIEKLGNYLNSEGKHFWHGDPGTNSYDEPIYWRILFAGQNNVFFNRLKQIVESGLYSFWKSLSMSIAVGNSKFFKKSGESESIGPKPLSLNSNFGSIFIVHLSCCGLVCSIWILLFLGSRIKKKSLPQFTLKLQTILVSTILMNI